MGIQKKEVFKTLSFLTVLTLLTKAFGFFRDALIAAEFGSSPIADSYFSVAGITVLLAELIVNSASTMVIPVLADVKKREGKANVPSYLAKLTTLLLITTTLLTLLGEIFAAPLIRLIAPGFAGEQMQFAVRLFRWGLPSMIASGIVGVFAGYLQSENHYYVASSTRLLFNLLCIFYLLFFADRYGFIGLMIVTVIASFIQYLLLRHSVKQTGYHYRFSLPMRDFYSRQALRLFLPVFLGIAVYDLNTLINRSFASRLSAGNISQLTYAAKLEGFVVGVFITTLLTYFYPNFSETIRYAKDCEALKRQVTEVINLNLILTVPATVGLFILAEPIVRIIFQRGVFTATNTEITAIVLQGYALGMSAKALREVAVRLSYILQYNRIALGNGIFLIAMNIVLNMLVLSAGNVALLALATSIATILSTVILFLRLWKKGQFFYIRKMILCCGKTWLAAILMGIFVKALYAHYAVYFQSEHFLIVCGATGLLIFLAVLLYFLLLFILRIDNCASFFSLLKRKGR